MQNVTDRTRNPFGMRPDCESFVPGYGDANADFHVVGDHPGVHGGVDAGIPFTGEPWSTAFLSALAEGGLIGGFDDSADDPATIDDSADGAETADPIVADRTFFSYLHMCVPDGVPDEASYNDMERFFDAELRAIAAHVLLPVGARATDHVLQQYTSRAHKTEIDMDALHAEELLGSGWLVLPIKDPAEWTEGDGDRLAAALRELQSTDFRRESDLGRFIAGSEPYLVR
ncbi:uracil-DNA glycosylase family protein [Halorubrum lacusprofundi]|nr:uracil-DNA glycosylase family protein [Halorubrum lacusprofundi]MCG1005479.1 uracil-DNA glycosylase [Halorubrum lacusprofundi]